MEKIKHYYAQNPLKSILILAFVVRFIAVVFSQGYGFHDDHFLVIEAAQSWIEKNNWNDWLPSVQKQIDPDVEAIPQGHSLVYAGVHYVFFVVMEFFGLQNPKAKMFLIRLIHALFSLLIVSYGYKIAKHYANEKVAKQVGLILALLWVMPFLSVHNLVEIVCIPFIMWGLWLLIKNEDKEPLFKAYFWAGLIMSLAISIRFQTVLIVGGSGLILLVQKRWKATIAFGIGALLSFVLLQSVIDYYIWGRPFAEFAEYVRYNLQAKNEYGHNVWYMYTTVLGGLVIPPLSIFLFVGWFLVLKKHPLLFWPSFLFFAFHNYFPNKQERFILPILPLFILAGVIGWWMYMDKSVFWTKNKKLFKPVMVIFWVLNFMVLPVFSTTYSKKSRCETMAYLGKQDDAKCVIIEESVRTGTTKMPMFYGAKNIQLYQLDRYNLEDSVHYLKPRFIKTHEDTITSPQEIKYNNWAQPEYVAFINEKNIDERVEKMKVYYPNLEYSTTIKPSYIDLLMRALTPSNNNQLVFIYKVNN
ncbi:MAG: glycosyltransferase family 39 protein [Salinivirgaceae bacterium]|jgi:hypothetical protein|nr:glycosyltransferase family 39 protein [Salinivirgaceae bacterium]